MLQMTHFIPNSIQDQCLYHGNVKYVFWTHDVKKLLESVVGIETKLCFTLSILWIMSSFYYTLIYYH